MTNIESILNNMNVNRIIVKGSAICIGLGIYYIATRALKRQDIKNGVVMFLIGTFGFSATFILTLLYNISMEVSGSSHELYKIVIAVIASVLIFQAYKFYKNKVMDQASNTDTANFGQPPRPTINSKRSELVKAHVD